MKEVLTKSALLMDDAYQKKALYLSEIEAADFDLEQAVIKKKSLPISYYYFLMTTLFCTLFSCLPPTIHHIYPQVLASLQKCRAGAGVEAIIKKIR